MKKLLSIALGIIVLSGCNFSAAKDAVDLVDGVPRRTIDTTKLGTNAFVNDGRFGSMSSQMREVRDTLRLKYVRVLFQWDDNSDPSPSGSPNFAFQDAVMAALPRGLDVDVVVTGAPSWMGNSANWIGGNPRRTFVERWFKKVVNRYGNNSKIVAWEVWNEPNAQTTENVSLDLVGKPENYVEMLALAHNVAKEAAPSKFVLNAATTSINQNYPDSLNYNRAIRDAGGRDFVDVWNIHYYGQQFEKLINSGGVADFLNGLGKPIWVTESGAQGVNEQLKYGEETWPYLLDKVDGIQRIYQYQFTEASPAASTYGLRNLTPGSSVSDLYVWLRDRK